MQRAVIRALEDKCIQNSPPGCTTMCPVHVDVKRLNELVLKGDFNQAAELFQKNIPFPEIISRICDHPCQVYCKRCDAGGSVRISMLEEACVKYGSYPQKTIKPFKKTGKRVAIAGSGLSGLTAAFHLHQKGHEIHIFEKNSIIGGRVRSYSSDRLPAELIDKDFAIISSMEIQIHTNTEIGRDISFEELLRTHDAVYLGLGEPLRQTGEPETPGIFKGGTMLRNGDYSPILSISEGRGAAISIDRYLKRVSLTEGRENEGQYTSSLYTSLEGVVSAEPVEPEEPQMGFSRDEALREASRCLQCECMECVKACVFLKQYEGYPKLYIREIANAVNQIYGVRKHKMMINSCTNCGLCAEVCPNRLDMGEVCRDAKTEMVEKELMPPAIHDFPINDMLFSNSDEFSMFRHQPGYEDSKYAFYPGCQLSGLRPGHVERVYKELSTELEGGVGLFLGCCGAPAQWSGRTGLYEAALAGFRKTWLENGRPVIIYACTSCHRMLGESFPEIEFISIWELMA
ncbi:MAG: NAD(P)-binding protein, partial [Clostridiales bacterium]|nr:NAD(P)-binding protein [Clostridiales bacterium]